MIRPCDNCGGDGYQVGPPTPCPRCPDMPRLSWMHLDFGNMPPDVHAIHRRGYFTPDPDTVMRWCFTHDSAYAGVGLRCDSVIAQWWHNERVGVESIEAESCDLGWVERPTRLEEVG